MSRPGVLPAPHVHVAAVLEVTTSPDNSRSSTASCKYEDEAFIPPLQDPDYRRNPSARLHPVDPNTWPPSQLHSTLEQLNGHDLMALFPTQAPKQLICCDDIFRSQARDFLAKQALPMVNIQESPEAPFDDEISGSPPLPVVEDVRAYMPRQRRTSKNESE
ncbi:hypothetical protein BDY19DRAFT_1060754 [Irpex rosettiformis]|uniref:Uncharacterized protein n=1 Tax=Irpex rosettiformis TaxID=378272 RepID=A0ACB8TPA0_9APHY|nr:hypothetical protein BDY19DRAFT_1060754 [Irpex rosettiformis]